MIEVFSEKIVPRCEITFCHGLDQELLVPGEEEETSTLAHTFSRLLDSLDVFVESWVQSCLQLFIVEAIFCSQESENVRSIFNAGNSLSDLSILDSSVLSSDLDEPEFIKLCFLLIFF